MAEVMSTLNVIIILAYVISALIIHLLYIKIVESANRRLSRATAWKWYYGYTVMAISLAIILYYFDRIDYESGIFTNIPAFIIYDLINEPLLHRGVVVPDLPLMLLSSIAGWLLIGWTVQYVKELRGYAIVLERLGKRAANSMIKRIRNRQLRHRIFQASFRGVQRAIEEKAREYGVSVIHIDPRNTSKLCPFHSAPITYTNGSRIGRCSRGGELWHRDVAATWNLLLRAPRGDGSSAPSPAGRLPLDGSRAPFGSTATHDPIGIPKSLWARWKSLPLIQSATNINRMKR